MQSQPTPSSRRPWAGSGTAGASAARALAGLRELPAATRTLTRCRVCGSAEVRTDEVVGRGLVWLAECRHCEYRWTRALPPEREDALHSPRYAARRSPEVSAAA